MVVAFGETTTPIPLVTGIEVAPPDLMTPMPPMNAAVKVTPVPVPLVIVAGAAVKLEMTGGSTTVTWAEAVTTVPAALVTSRM